MGEQRHDPTKGRPRDSSATKGAELRKENDRIQLEQIINAAIPKTLKGKKLFSQNQLEVEYYARHGNCFRISMVYSWIVTENVILTGDDGI